MRHDVIMALASGVGRSAIAVFRLSGEGTAAVLSQLCGAMPPPRHASLRRLRDRDGAALDDAIVLWLPGPASYTGEDSGELHVHGGAAVREALFRTLADFGARLAAPGEFTRRAFINGKLDLLQAEAVADLVDAETEGQRRQALRQLRGELGSLYGGWMTRLRGLLAVEEALIDFPDEALPPELETENAREISALAGALAGHLGGGRRGEHMREGIFIAVVGLPNVGKSSLVNRLAGRDVAIVTAMPGTTRDAIEVRLDLDGIPATLIDTAGLRETDDPIEREGIARALARADAADLVIELREPGLAGQSPSADRARLVVVNKIDTGTPPPGVLGISCLTGAGFDELRIALAGEAARLSGDAEGPALTRARHRTCVETALASLIAARGTRIPELRAEELRLAVKALGEITGAVTVDALLDDLFLRFCIGK